MNARGAGSPERRLALTALHVCCSYSTVHRRLLHQITPAAAMVSYLPAVGKPITVSWFFLRFICSVLLTAGMTVPHGTQCGSGLCYCTYGRPTWISLRVLHMLCLATRVVTLRSSSLACHQLCSTGFSILQKIIKISTGGTNLECAHIMEGADRQKVLAHWCWQCSIIETIGIQFHLVSAVQGDFRLR